MRRELLGQVDVTSGTLLVFDVGLVATFAERGSASAAAAAAIGAGRTQVPVYGDVNAIVVRGVANGRYSVACDYLQDGRRAAVSIDFSGEGRSVARTVALGEVVVESSRIGVFDVDAFDHFSHSAPADGLADVAFFGEDAEEVARRLQASPLVNDAFGFVDLPVDDAAALAEKLHALRDTGELDFDFELRPHNDHYRLLTRMRSSALRATSIEIGAHSVCAFMTTWGSGSFAVLLEVDADDRPLRCIVRFAT